MLEVERLKAGSSASVNGQTVNGPALIVRKSKLGEASFVPLGADSTTVARMVASNNSDFIIPETLISKKEGNQPMNFEEWLKAQGFSIADLSEKQKETLLAAFNSQNSSHQGNHEGNSSADDDQKDIVADLRAAAAAEAKRIAGLRKVCAGNPDLEAQAIAEGWDETKAELEVLRASRTGTPALNFNNHDQGVNGSVLEAGLMLSAGLDTNKVDERSLEAAHKRYRSRLGLQEFILECAWANGYSGRSFRSDPEGVLRAAFGNLNAAFSNINIGGILSNIANKALMQGWLGVDTVWRLISAIGRTSDFKEFKRYRLTGDSQYRKVAPGGEIEMGTIGEAEYSNKVDAYGLRLAISRTDMINDDLGALNDVPRHLGRGAGLKVNDVFWAEFLDNAAFFSAANDNFFDGDPDSLLTIEGLTQAERLFLDQVDEQGKPVSISPALLVLPTALAAVGRQLMNSAEVRDPAAGGAFGTANPHAGKYEVLTSPYLSNASYAGASGKAWYLLANPADFPVIETVFLNGQESPFIESTQADFNTLGIAMRGYHDFGVRKQEFRGGVKGKGEA